MCVCVCVCGETFLVSEKKVSDLEQVQSRIPELLDTRGALVEGFRGLVKTVEKVPETTLELQSGTKDITSRVDQVEVQAPSTDLKLHSLGKTLTHDPCN